MNRVREKLIALLSQVQYLGGLEEKVADHLIANGVTVQEWVSVKERLPQVREVQWDDLRYMESELVLGFGGDGIAVVKCTQESGADRWLWIDIDGNVWPVSHWMPLTEIPKGGIANVQSMGQE